MYPIVKYWSVEIIILKLLRDLQNIYHFLKIEKLKFEGFVNQYFQLKYKWIQVNPYNI
jgi:hypothetical protein